MRKDLSRRTGRPTQLPPDIEQKRRAVVRDWWRTVLWFVRLRRAAKPGGYTPISLIEVEEFLQKQKLWHGKERAKQARLNEYVENFGSDGEESSEVEDPMK